MSVQVYFDDLDPYGMLHHVRYGTLVDRAIVAYWTEKGWNSDLSQSAIKEVMVVRQLSITYQAPITGVCEPVVHFWLEGIGRSSVIYGFRLLSPDRSLLYADGRRVSVNIDPVTLAPAPISEESRRLAQELLVPATAGASAPR
ncbi:acyl-CoA thioester hydrolase [Thermocatellispora tengchongensis]|uniref:Acyl-CoA thioester hydrolase n=1 Tax=Thermocatellispora tengchongensis TaxID=1073253 RepID=A0A840PM89_9ACTN|nr:thioesterase family protein [Thermocatellispora tengchongensis]MBB5140608.1 acyl-CoA thioester hydrolase [Thermocatellispora tengchongensis]